MCMFKRLSSIFLVGPTYRGPDSGDPDNNVQLCDQQQHQRHIFIDTWGSGNGIYMDVLQFNEDFIGIQWAFIGILWWFNGIYWDLMEFNGIL